MIRADDVMPLVLAALPSFAGTWHEITSDETHVGEDGTRLHYLDAGHVARHLLELHRGGAVDEVRAAFEVIERLHLEGDGYVLELATIGYLEGVQTSCSHATDVAAHDFESYLGPESRRWWNGLLDFWDGRADGVRAKEVE